MNDEKERPVMKKAKRVFCVALCMAFLVVTISQTDVAESKAQTNYGTYIGTYEDVKAHDYCMILKVNKFTKTYISGSLKTDGVLYGNGAVFDPGYEDSITFKKKITIKKNKFKIKVKSKNGHKLTLVFTKQRQKYNKKFARYTGFKIKSAKNVGVIEWEPLNNNRVFMGKLKYTKYKKLWQGTSKKRQLSIDVQKILNGKIKGYITESNANPFEPGTTKKIKFNSNISINKNTGTFKIKKGKKKYVKVILKFNKIIKFESGWVYKGLKMKLKSNIKPWKKHKKYVKLEYYPLGE